MTYRILGESPIYITNSSVDVVKSGYVLDPGHVDQGGGANLVGLPHRPHGGVE